MAAIYGKHGTVIPGKEGLEFHVIVWISGQTQTVDMIGLIIIEAI